MMRARCGLDYGGTASWLHRYQTESDLNHAVFRLWSQSDLPLKNWANSIKSVGAVINTESTEFGIHIALAEKTHGFVIQQSPMDTQFCRSRLLQLCDAADDLLVNVFSFTPGLRIEWCPVIALGSFITQPFDSVAQGWVGAGRTVNSCIHADIGVFTPEQCALEVVWNRRTEKDFVALSRDGRIFVYACDETTGLDESTWTFAEMLNRYFEDPHRFFEAAVASRKPGGQIIECTGAGDKAREEYERLSLKEKIAVSLRVAYRSLLGADDSPEWADMRNGLDACCHALVRGAKLDSGILDVINHDKFGTLSLRPDSNSLAMTVTVVGHVVDTIRVLLGEKSELRYPDHRLYSMGCPPVYTSVLIDIDHLRAWKQVMTESDAIRHLLDAPVYLSR